MNDRTNQGEDTPNDGTFERIGEELGGAAGRLMERGTEMAGGMFGSMVDNLMNTLGDWWSTPDAGEAAQTFDSAEQNCRRHFEASPSIDRDYDEVRPLYQFGYVASQNPSYQGRQFADVEPDLQKAWRSDEKSSSEDWSDVRGYVDFGYTRDSIDRLDL